MLPIYMDSFTWQVAATFCAAAGAIAVGWRQVGIAKRQADIAASQRDIARAQAETAAATFKIAEAQALTAKLAQRANLFDRRFDVFKVVQRYLRTSLASDAFTLIDLDKDLRKALNKSRFLFPDTITANLLSAIDLADKVADLQLQRKINGEGEMGPELRSYRKELRDVLAKLFDMMGSEMKLHYGEET